MSQQRSTTPAFFAVSLFVLAATLGPLASVPMAAAQTPAAPVLETLLNRPLEGSAVEKNGFTLHYDGAETSAGVVRSGTQSVDLASGPSTPRPSFELGLVKAYASHPVLLTQVYSIGFHKRIPAEPPSPVELQLFFGIDLDGDGVSDRCAFKGLGPAVMNNEWQHVLLGSASSFAVSSDGICNPAAPLRTLGDLQADAAFASATVSVLQLQTVVTSPDLWPIGASVYIDDFSMQATSSPLVRIKESALNLCGGASFDNFESAEVCAAEGATLLLGPGTIPGGFVVDKRLTLCGTDHMAPDCRASTTETLVTGGGAYVIRVRADDVRIQNLTVTNPAYAETGAVDPALVVVYANRTTLANLVLKQPAQALGLNQVRTATAGVSVGPHVTDLVIEDSRIREMTSSRGAGATCATNLQPCRTFGVTAWGQGHGAITLRRNTIHMGGAHPSTAVNLAGGQLTLVDNVISVSATDATSPRSFAVVSPAASLGGWTLRGNVIDIADGATAQRAIGVSAHLDGAIVAHNTFRNLHQGLVLGATATGGNEVSDNLFTGNAEGLRNHAPNTLVLRSRFANNAAGIVLAGDGGAGGSSAGFVVRASNLTDATALLLAAATRDLVVDARENNWGAYSRSEIRGRIDDEGQLNRVDESCYIDSDQVSRVCPPTAQFTWSPSSPKWNREIQFISQASSERRTISSHEWHFGDGDVSFLRDPVHTYPTPGTRSVTLIVHDSEGYSGRITKTVNVVNNAPVLSSIGNRSVSEGQRLAIRLSATDAEGDRLTFSATPLPAGASIVRVGDASADFVWTPSYTQEGNYTVTFSVTDGIATASETIGIAVAHANAPPTLEIRGPLAFNETEEITIYFIGHDVDGTLPEVTVTTRPDGSNWARNLNNGSATFVWTPTFLQSGRYTVGVQVSDGVLKPQFYVNLTVIDLNRAPQFNPSGPFLVSEGIPIEFIVYAQDPDGDVVRYGMHNAPSGARFNASSRVFSWTPDYESQGVHYPRFAAGDGNATSFMDVEITVVQANRPPTMLSLANQSVKANRTLSVALGATDPDRDALVFTAPDAPAGVQISGSWLTWRPLPSQMGNHTFNVTVTDVAGAFSNTTVNISVTENLAPAVFSYYEGRAEVGRAVTFRANGSYDPDGVYPLAYRWDFDSSDGIGVDRLGDVTTWTFPRIGQFNVTLVVLDSDGIQTRVNHTVIVDDVVYLNAFVDRNYYATGSNYGAGLLRDWRGQPLPNQTLEVTILYEARSYWGEEIRRFNVTTDAQGWAVFVIPRDTQHEVEAGGTSLLLPGLANLPGQHRLRLTANVPDSYLGDVETATAEATYGDVLA